MSKGEQGEVCVRVCAFCKGFKSMFPTVAENAVQIHVLQFTRAVREGGW